ncbi:MAG: hypothetical protein ACLP9L_21150 [Thermoguttaceae bacterium]
MPGTPTIEKAYDEIVDLFARGSSPLEILRFHPSRAAQRRARYLLNRNKAGELTDDEAAELERLGQFEHLVQLVKARAHLHEEVDT